MILSDDPTDIDIDIVKIQNKILNIDKQRYRLKSRGIYLLLNFNFSWPERERV